MYYYVTKDTMHTVSEHAMQIVRRYFSREDLEALQANEVICAPMWGHQYPCWIISGDKTLLGAFREEAIDHLVAWLTTLDASLTKQIGKVTVSRTRVAPLIDDNVYNQLIREKEEPVERDYLNVWTEEPVGGFYFLAKTPHGRSVTELTDGGCVRIRPWAEVTSELQDRIYTTIGHIAVQCMWGNELIVIPKNAFHKWYRRVRVEQEPHAWASQSFMATVEPMGIATLNEWLLQNKLDTIQIGQFILRNMSIETPIPRVSATKKPEDKVLLSVLQDTRAYISKHAGHLGDMVDRVDLLRRIDRAIRDIDKE